MLRNKNVKLFLSREKIHEIIFEADTLSGKYFDIGLLVAIVISVLLVMAESVPSLQVKYSNFFFYAEWFFTILFTIEYILRLYCVYRPMKYATSFFGVVDLLAILPAYLSLVLAGSQFFVVIRAFRLMRVFRILKLGHFMTEGSTIMEAMRRSRARISVFLFFIIITVTIIGAVMYVVEGEHNDSFTSIPRAIYWAIVTLTTVGYGDISPQTPLGQFLASMVMVLGYAVIAVPTGIVSSEMIKSDEYKKFANTQACKHCSQEGHANDAVYCKYCGEHL